MTLRDQLESRFRAAATVKKITLDGLDVYVRAITCAEKEQYQVAVVDRAPNSIARFCCLVLADEAGNRLYKDVEVDQLAAFPAKALDTIWDAGLEWNHMGQGAREKKTDANGALLVPAGAGVPDAGR